MSREKLDATDKELLLVLANNPEWTYEELADHMGMTSRSVGYRIERLREMKVIPAKSYFNRPPFEGPGTRPPFA